jgi:putative endonuclease
VLTQRNQRELTDSVYHRVLYITKYSLSTGVTGNLSRRLFEHKNRVVPGFTSRYNLTRLVYCECFVYPDAAISREKEIKGWRRSKMIQLIESLNPHWHDLAKSWPDVYKPRAVGSSITTRQRRRAPSPRAPDTPSPSLCSLQGAPTNS